MGNYYEKNHDSTTERMDKVELENRILDALEKLPEQCRLVLK